MAEVLVGQCQPAFHVESAATADSFFLLTSFAIWIVDATSLNFRLTLDHDVA